MKNYFLLFTLLVIFGLSWPVNKIALGYTSPSNFTLLRMVFAVLTIFSVNLSNKKLRADMFDFRMLLSKQILISILVVGVFQVGLMMTLMNMGMHYIGSGVAAILAYTTPLLMFPISVLIFKQDKFWSLKGMGILFGFCGILTILSTASQQSWVGELLLVLVAFSSGISILYIKLSSINKKKLYSGYIYQLLVAIIVAYLLFRGTGFPGTNDHIHLSIPLVLCALYCGCLATGLGFVILSHLSAELPPTVLSFALLGVPIIGNLGSVFFLGEKMVLSTFAGFVFIITGLIIFLFNHLG